jgi:hypothetical protein
MKTSKHSLASQHSLYEAVLARISLGAVPIDGIYWFDPRPTTRVDAGQQGKTKDVKPS